jgi:phage baseplate assembly protein W
MAKLYNQKTVATNKASIGNINPRPFAYKGFNSRNSKTGFKQYDIDLIKQDLLNHFHIKKGQKLENPDFGTSIWDMIFEPMSEENKKMVTEDVENIVNNDPRTKVNSVVIEATEHGIRIQVEMTYIPFNVIDSMILDFDSRNIPTI